MDSKVQFARPALVRSHGAPSARFLRLVATASVGLAALPGCAGDDDRLTQGSNASTKSTSTGDNATAVSGDDFDADEPEFEEELLAFYDQFIYAGDQHRTPDKSVLEGALGALTRHQSQPTEYRTPPATRPCRIHQIRSREEPLIDLPAN